eukprot:g66962.t1
MFVPFARVKYARSQNYLFMSGWVEKSLRNSPCPLCDANENQILRFNRTTSALTRFCGLCSEEVPESQWADLHNRKSKFIIGREYFDNWFRPRD